MMKFLGINNKPGQGAIALAVALAVILAPSLVQAKAGGDAGEVKVLTENALWEAAGNAYSKGSDKSAAMQQYRLFVQEYGGSQHAADAQYMLAECYFASEDFEGALREYDKVKGKKGLDDYLKASVLLRQGECYYNLGQYSQAIKRYDRLVSKYDDTFMLAEGLYEIGLAYIVEGNWLKLNSAYRELLETRPGYAEKPQVKFALGLFAYQDQNYEEAITYFSEVPCYVCVL